MYEETFKNLGMSPNEAKIYEELIHLGESSINTISVKTNVNRSNVYDAMERLVEKGLAAGVMIKGQKHFRAAHPRRLLELLKEKQEEIEHILPDLTKKFEFHHQEEEVHFYRGIEGYKNYMFDILKEGKTYYCIGAKGMWFDPRLKFFRMKFDRERKKSNIQFKHIFDEEVKTKSPEPLQFEKNRYKFLPKKYCSNLTIEFFGDYTVIYTGEDYGKLKEKPTLFVLKSKEIADGFKKLFQFMWDKSS
ncbi:MAG TPA: helix-turn-helix domain-containing protein [Candidatus Nanoarchaeia archaeon]|nr:helix-turn-helix domain-containing protein [Candidatus Nanoarchaeia archaeon]